ncbi:MAG: translation elongation factor Ts [Bacteroidetes bacterium RBG_13_46_8]|nr:MAG: translation elongation factor Ts [Bacteroidetes bacterium RBG_13_46_8]
MAVTAADVSKLRKMTGAGMMDCKHALEEANGDYEKAVEIIRKKGQLVASKRADREAGQGVVLAKASADGKRGAMIVLNCETDFVAKNENFINFARSILNLAVEKNPADLDALKQLTMEGRKVGDQVTEQVGIIGEKIELSYYNKIEASQVVAYIHMGNMLATLVGLNKTTSLQTGKDVAMQVAAMNPVAVDKDSVPASTIAKEKEIALEQTKNDPRNQGKPASILERIAEGKLEKFFKEGTLLNQEFTKDSSKTMRQYLQSVDKDLTVTGFLRYSLK